MAITILLGIVGVLLLGGGIYAWTRASAENKTRDSWPSVAGTVKDSVIGTELQGTGNEKRRVAKYTMNYSYVVDGKTHSGNIYTEAMTHFPALEAKYRSGSPVTVFYNPANPSHHDIKEPLAHSGNLTTGKIAFFLIILGVIALGAAPFAKQFVH